MTTCSCKYLVTFCLLLALFSKCLTAQQTDSTVRVIPFDDTRRSAWPPGFEVVDIPSPVDGEIQKAYVYKSTGDTARPLIVSLHTWSGDYQQEDAIARLAASENCNYIHPDFRGPNRSAMTCCSELAMADIEAAIEYAIKNLHVDSKKIYVIGVSGGGFATLNTFIRSRHKIKKFSAWASISDLAAWYEESKSGKSSYARDILNCTGSLSNVLDLDEAKKRSPLFVPIPAQKLKNTELNIFAGVSDGLTGSVPFTHSVHFYNRVLKDLHVRNKSLYVSDAEINQLIETRKPVANFGRIGGRDICLVKQYKTIRLTIFAGGHEMLTAYAFDQLMK